MRNAILQEVVPIDEYPTHLLKQGSVYTYILPLSQVVFALDEKEVPAVFRLLSFGNNANHIYELYAGGF